MNNLKIAWRSLWNHKAYSFINIAGLSIGLTACLIVATVVLDELSYDHQWKKGDDIYRVLSVSAAVKGAEPQPIAFSGFGPSVKNAMPEVESYCRMSVNSERLQLGKSTEGVKFQNLFAEQTIWNMLDFNVIEGNPKKFVEGYVNLIITEKIRHQYFANQNPIGKIITTVPEYGKPNHYLITGVIKDIPQNTHLRADIITLNRFGGSYNSMPIPSAGYTSVAQYVLLKQGTSKNAFTAKVNQWYANQVGVKKVDNTFQFQPIKDVYLHSDFAAVQAVHGSMRNVYIFGGVAALLLLIACINFINLTVSRIFNRSKETGIRKVLGAGKWQLLLRFLSESIIFFAISFLVALVLYPLFLKSVETYIGHPLVLNLLNGSFLIIVVCCVFLISLLTGLYPAWFLSRPQPIVILRNKVASDVHLNFLKKALVVGQFVISAIIIMATFIVHNQLDFMDRKDLGFDKNNLLNISYTTFGTQAAAFKQLVRQLPGVDDVSISRWRPTEEPGNMVTVATIPGKKEKIKVFYIQGDADLAVTLKLKVSKGRMLNPQIVSDAMNADSSMSFGSRHNDAMRQVQPYIATNFTASLFGLKLNSPIPGIDGQPVGVVQDFNSESLHTKLQPTVIQAISDLKGGNMLIRIKPGFEKRVLESVNKSYKAFYPESPFSYDWVSQLVDNQYKTEYKLQQLFTCFSLLIVFLACLGLFGLVSFTAEQRVKEIGIRKVLGASVKNIITLISKDYILLVTIALLVASPIAWYTMNKWLEDFAYRVNIQWWVFALTGFVALLIAFVTISFQSIKAAMANPVKSLRSE